MKTRFQPTAKAGPAYMLIECLVYIGLVFAILGVGYAALYRCINDSIALRRNADDITRSLLAGERWRADLRSASGPARLETSLSAEQLLVIPARPGDISYRFSNQGVFRRVADRPWSQMLPEVQSATVESEARGNVSVWRWELELRTKGKAGRIKPLFTFIGVAGGNP